MEENSFSIGFHVFEELDGLASGKDSSKTQNKFGRESSNQPNPSTMLENKNTQLRTTDAKEKTQDSSHCFYSVNIPKKFFLISTPRRLPLQHTQCAPNTRPFSVPKPQEANHSCEVRDVIRRPNILHSILTVATKLTIEIFFVSTPYPRLQ